MSNELQVTDGNKKDLFTLAPRNLEEAMKYAEMICQTEMVPKDFRGKAGNVLVAVQMGAEVGLPPTQALQNIAVINGRPSIWGDAVLALIMGRSDLEDFDEYFDDNGTAFCKIKRKNRRLVERSFGVEDAKQAGLSGKQGPWTQYPKRMRQMRARAFAVRDAYPDVMKGMHIAEESQDLPVQEKEINPVEDKKPATRAEAIKDKINKTKSSEPKKEEAPAEAEIDSDKLWEEIQVALDEAKTIEELTEAVSRGPDLSKEHREKARFIYKFRRYQIEGYNVEIVGGDIVDIDTGEKVGDVPSK